MCFHMDDRNTLTGCSSSQSRFRRWRRRSATIPFKWSFRCSTTAKKFWSSIWTLICVANQLPILNCTRVSFDRIVVEVDVGFLKSILRPPSLQPVKRDVNSFESRMLPYLVTRLEWLEVKYMVTKKFMLSYLSRP